MPHDHFYKNIKPLDSFQSLSKLKHYHDVPNDWVIIITDVVMSTKAIENGKYRDVNAVGALAIVAVLNTISELEIPFVFGGDGATLLVPKKYINKTRDALLHTRKIAKSQYQLDLRVGIVDVYEVLQAGHVLKLAKFTVSPTYDQAIIAGSGIDYAESLVKDPKVGRFYSLGEDLARTPANFMGFSCRWQDIPSRHGETISLIVKVSELLLETQVEQYGEIVKTIYTIYGDNHQHHPIHFSGLNLSLDPTKINGEVKINGKNTLSKLIILSRVYAENLVGKLSAFKNSPVNGFSMENHRNRMILSTDHKKFDGSLKMVISGTESQRLELTKYLDRLSEMNLLKYGLHTSNRAILTCLVFDGSGKEVHFVDAADGGYALAAKTLKKLNNKLSNI